MSGSLKIILIAVSSLLILAVIVFGVFLFFNSPIQQEGIGGEFPSGTENVFPGTGTQTGTGTPGEEGGIAQGSASSIRQVSAGPVAGATSFMRDGAEIIRYIERGTGNVYETRADSSTTVRLSNMTIPGIQEALWFGNGNGLILRYLDKETIKTFSARIATSTRGGEGKLEGVSLPDNIEGIAVSPTGDKLFYLRAEGGGIAGTVSNTDGSGGIVIFRSPLRAWNVSWPSANTILLTTKPSESAEGISYTLDVKSRSLATVMSERSSLTSSMSPDGKLLLASGVVAGERFMTVKNLSTKKESSIAFTTFPEDKCVWRNSLALYCAVPYSSVPPGALEAWYRGEISFSDSLWNVSASTTVATLETIFDGLSQTFDITKPFITPDGTHFLFTNKKDLTLWSVRIQNPVAATGTPSAIR